MGMSGTGSSMSSGPVVHYSSGTSTSGTSGTTPISLRVAPGVIDVKKLSIDELMEWITVQLNKTDGELQRQMNKMSKAKDQQAAVAKLIETLRKAHGGAPSGTTCKLDPDPRLTDAYKSLSPEGKDVIDKLCEDAGATPDRAMGAGETLIVIGDSKTYDADAAVKAGLAYVGTDGKTYVKGNPPGVVDKAKVAEVLEAMDKELSATTSSNEMDMIKLQSAISARGQMIQLVSNMIHQMDETSKSIVGNVR